jgi:4-alpha-glucanotransferase
MIRCVLASVAHLALFPMQDLLGLGSEARMNRPGTEAGNWEWRMREGAFSATVQQRLTELTRIYDRAPRAEGAERRRARPLRLAAREARA